jgi:hypothetical protein
MHEWEADRASRFGAGLLFWCWYLPADVVRHRRALGSALRAVNRGGMLLTYPLYAPPARKVAEKVPVRSR